MTERNDLADYSSSALVGEIVQRYFRDDGYTGGVAWAEDGLLDRLEIKAKTWLPPCNGNCACGGGGEPPKED